MPAAKPSKNLTAAFSSNFGNRSVFADSAVQATDCVAADTIDLVKIPGGTLVDRVVIKNPDLDSATALTAKIGFAAADGSSTSQDATVAADGAWGRTAATTTYELFPPVLVAVDSYLRVTVGTGATGSSGGGTVYGKVEGEALGMK